MKLVIVESPTKARTIGKFLGKGYEIRASMGHVMDLPKSKLGVDVEHDFTPQYEINSDKKKTIAELKKLTKTADEIILATDPDREGEAIAAHIAELLTVDNRKLKIDIKGRKSKIEKKKVNLQPSSVKKLSSIINPLPSISRIVFHEITKEAIEDALKNPGVVNENLVDAQTARRVLDRLVGYKLSPLLWQKVRRGLSAGRVQSVALRLIVEREREIEKFKKQNYWTVDVLLKNNTDFELIEINGIKIETQESFSLYNGKYTISKTSIDNADKANKILEDLKKKSYTVADVLKKETKRTPAPPFTTSTLQQQASQRFGYSGKRTMSLAQKLYEEGLITYHRTDSVALAGAAITKMRSFIEKEFGKKYVPEKPKFYTAKQKLAQEAHEAIRPTSVERLPARHASLQGVAGGASNVDLGNDYAKLYEMIWKRAVASQMADALIESTTVVVTTNKQQLTTNEKELAVSSEKLAVSSYLFKTTGSVLVFDGFLRVNPFGLEDKNLPAFKSGENLDLLKANSLEHETPPPPRYNDASLIKSLEEEGIGRPSTYASIISTIENRNYIERESRKFLPTPIGITVNDFLVSNFSNIDDIPFTAAMEDEFDSVAKGEKKWRPVIKEFYVPFEKKLMEVKNVDRVKIQVEETGEKCPKDQGDLVIRVGKFGKFISCNNFPTCDFKKPYVEETGFICPKDNGKVVIKKTKKGRNFYGCSNYPKCDFAAWKLGEIKKDTETTTKN